MYAIAIIRYRRPLDEVLKVVDEHRAYLKRLLEQGLLLASGPFDPRHGGALLLRVPDESVAATLDQIRDGDPFIQKGVAQYELLPWAPVLGKEELDKVFSRTP
ncbi:YciI family protein [Sorangium sp. So ce1153]|uniref:YciI family protein n=1 Tax=Sorangium sp. So ce1153 TaxID=3133333 RepID=UPI003F5D6F61